MAVLRQELFAGLILSSPAADADPKVAGRFTVSGILVLYNHNNINVLFILIIVY